MVYNVNSETERRVFKNLSNADRDIALYEIVAHLRDMMQGFMDRIANIERKQIEFESELRSFEKELRKRGDARERREKKLAELLDTTPPIKDMKPEDKQNTIDKITAIINKRDETWMPVVRDLIRIIIAALAIIGGSKLLP